MSELCQTGKRREIDILYEHSFKTCEFLKIMVIICTFSEIATNVNLTLIEVLIRLFNFFDRSFIFRVHFRNIDGMKHSCTYINEKDPSLRFGSISTFLAKE